MKIYVFIFCNVIILSSINPYPLKYLILLFIIIFIVIIIFIIIINLVFITIANFYFSLKILALNSDFQLY